MENTPVVSLLETQVPVAVVPNAHIPIDISQYPGQHVCYLLLVIYYHRGEFADKAFACPPLGRWSHAIQWWVDCPCDHGTNRILIHENVGSKAGSKRNSHSEGTDVKAIDVKAIDANLVPVLLEKQLTEVEAQSASVEDVFPDGGLQVRAYRRTAGTSVDITIHRRGPC
jgi:hypothetical protein